MYDFLGWTNNKVGNGYEKMPTKQPLQSKGGIGMINSALPVPGEMKADFKGLAMQLCLDFEFLMSICPLSYHIEAVYFLGCSLTIFFPEPSQLPIHLLPCLKFVENSNFHCSTAMIPQSPKEAHPGMATYNDEKERVEFSSSSDEKKQSVPEGDQPAMHEHEYLTGIKLILVLASATVASFLMLLDMTIIATV